MEIKKGQKIETNIGTIEVVDVIENYYTFLEGEKRTCVKCTLDGRGDGCGAPYADSLPDFIEFIQEVQIKGREVLQSLIKKSSNNF